MPSLHMIVASGTAQRRLLEETIASYAKQGYALSSRQEGGEWVSLLSENMSGGLFDDNRLVVVDEADQMGALPKKLLPLVERESSVILLLVYAKSPSKLFPKDVLNKSKILKPEEFPRWPNERQRWVNSLARKNKIKINSDAVALIVDLMDDPEEIRSQLKSLGQLKHGDIITLEDVDLMCLNDGSKSLLRILDGLCYCKVHDVMKNFYMLKRNGELLPLISALHNRMRLAWYHAENPTSSAEFSKALGARNYAWRQASNAAQIYPKTALKEFSFGLIRLNIAEKSGTGAGWSQLETMLIKLLSNYKKTMKRYSRKKYR